MAVGTGAPQNGGIDPVFIRHSGDSPADLQLAEASRQLQIIAHQHVPGDVGIQRIHAVNADGAEHLPALGIRIRDIASHKIGSFLSH